MFNFKMNFYELFYFQQKIFSELERKNAYFYLISNVRSFTIEFAWNLFNFLS